jgi:hypothetical protein
MAVAVTLLWPQDDRRQSDLSGPWTIPTVARYEIKYAVEEEGARWSHRSSKPAWRLILSPEGSTPSHLRQLCPSHCYRPPRLVVARRSSADVSRYLLRGADGSWTATACPGAPCILGPGMKRLLIGS